MKYDLLLKNLKEKYATILSQIDFKNFSADEDYYSGVFLSKPTELYFNSDSKIMLVGRETAGWNTKNKLNTINRLETSYKNKDLHNIIDESWLRYDKHLNDLTTGFGKPLRSHFLRFLHQVAAHFQVPPHAIMYNNLLAWDYKQGSPLNRPLNEKVEIIGASIKLLAAQIRDYQPNIIIFATGYSVDKIIKDLFINEFDGWETDNILPRKLWQFSAAGAKCFRIAHPRAMSHGHPDTRKHLFTLLRNP